MSIHYHCRYLANANVIPKAYMNGQLHLHLESMSELMVNIYDTHARCWWIPYVTHCTYAVIGGCWRPACMQRYCRHAVVICTRHTRDAPKG